MIDAVFYAAVKDVFDGRLYPGSFPQTVEGVGLSRLPAGRYQIVSATNAADICGTGTRDTDDTRIQLDIVASDWDALIGRVDAVIAALAMTDPPCTRDNYFTTFDVETRTHRAAMDFVFYASSAVSS